MESKECTKCHTEKPLTDFFRERRQKDGRESRCKACAAVCWRLWKERNEDKRKEWQRNYNIRRKQNLKIWGRNYYMKNKERIKKRTREYQIKNKDKCVLFTVRRNAMAKGLRADLTVEQWNIIKAVFRNKCAYCGKRTKRLEREHIIPISKGGCFTLRNIVPSCRSCNAKKHANLPEIPVKMLLF